MVLLWKPYRLQKKLTQGVVFSGDFQYSPISALFLIFLHYLAKIPKKQIPKKQIINNNKILNTKQTTLIFQ